MERLSKDGISSILAFLSSYDLLSFNTVITKTITVTCGEKQFEWNSEGDSLVSRRRARFLWPCGLGYSFEFKD